MRKATMVFLMLLLPTLLGSVVTGDQKLSPERVVEMYCRYALVGDLAKVKEYTAKIPKEYWDYQTKAPLEQKENDKQARKGNGPKGSKDVIVTLDSSGVDEMWLPMVNKFFPTTLSEGRQVYKGVAGVRVKGREAKVKVRLGSKDAASGRMEWQFLLHQNEDGEWKIFMIQLPNSQEKYGEGFTVKVSN